MWISTAQLAVGMIVDHDVKMNEIMLVKKDTPLTEAHIRSLKRWNVSKVSIMRPEGEGALSEPMLASQTPRFSDQQYMREKTRIDLLFRNVERDPQMKLIKDCVLSYIEERDTGE